MSANRQDGSRTYRWLRRLFRTVLRVFFRSVEVSGLENIPAEGGGLVVAWPPNGVIDGVMILACMERPVVVGARHGLFKLPVIGWLLRNIGAVPLYRRRDFPAEGGEEARRFANGKSLEMMAEAVRRGAFAALFPEGRTHDEPGLVGLKTGAARLFYDIARATPGDAPRPVIVPVGLHYDKKNFFRSRVLVIFHPPMELGALGDPVAADAPFETKRDQAHELTAEIERVLVDVVMATESWEIHQLMHRLRKLVRAERAHRAGAALPAASMTERTLGYQRVWAGYQHRRTTHPDETNALMERLARYDADLHALGLADRELDRGPTLAVTRIASRLLIQVLLIYLVLPPILLLGYIVNAPIALLVRRLGRLGARQYKGEASVTLFAGIVLFPLTWSVFSLLAGFGVLQLGVVLPRVPTSAPWLAAAATWILCGIGGLVALRYHRLARETWRTVRVSFTRSRRQSTVDRLSAERARLHDDTMRLAEGLDLPGAVGSDGRVVPAP